MTREEKASVLERCPQCDDNSRCGHEWHQDACEWTEDSDGKWAPSCWGEALKVSVAPTTEMKAFCGYCGGTLVERPYVELQNDTQEPA